MPAKAGISPPHETPAFAGVTEIFVDSDTRLKRLKFRAWHRGTREADLLIGGFFDKYGAGWDDAGRDWFEALLEEQDVDIMAWAMSRENAPEQYAGPCMTQLQALGYVPIAQ